jgi:hypothetical protein
VLQPGAVCDGTDNRTSEHQEQLPCRVDLNDDDGGEAGEGSKAGDPPESAAEGRKGPAAHGCPPQKQVRLVTSRLIYCIY